MDLTLTALAPEYERMFDLCKIDPKKREEVEHAITSILKNAPIYDSVSQFTNVPWWWIGLIHMRESSFDFRCHIHNGDPLTARTVHVPANRPVTGQPPFTWQDSAIDALRFENLHKWQNWSIVGSLFRSRRTTGSDTGSAASSVRTCGALQCTTSRGSSSTTASSRLARSIGSSGAGPFSARCSIRTSSTSPWKRLRRRESSIASIHHRFINAV
jgi:lysozyme family protein